MAIPISNVNSTTDTFLDWLDKTNQVLDNLSTKIITTEANTSGGVTTGNAYVNGTVSANVVAVIDTLRGGSVASPNTLTIASNTRFINATANIFVLTSNVTTSSLTANIVDINVNSTNTNINGGTLAISANTIISAPVTFSGVVNAVSNTSVGSNALFVDTTNRRVIVYGTDSSNTANRLEVNGNTFIAANLYVQDRIEANVIAVDTFSVTGNIAFSGTSDGDFRPASNAFALGNTSNRWILYSSSGSFANDVNVSGNTVTSNLLVGSNVLVNSSALFVGNNTVNTVITAGVASFTGNVSIGNTLVNTFISASEITTAANIATSGILSSGDGSFTGNVSVTNAFTANTITAQGSGSVGGTFAAGNTTISGFVNATSTLSVGANVQANTSALFVGNSSVNAVIVSNQLKIGNSSVNTSINPSIINVGVNTSINASSFKVGNTISNAVLTETSLRIGSSSVNTVITSSLISGSPNTVFNVTNTSSLNVSGATTIGTSLAVGSNVNLNTSSVVVGNSSVNSVVTATNISTTGTISGNGNAITNINASSLGTGTVAINRGGTGATSASGALTNLLPTGTIAGYVLTTGGPGNFYWAPGGSGGGGGATPGTTINSTRLSYVANGTANTFTAPTYVPGASQLRVYFDGVRQFASEYTEANTTSVQFNSAPPNGTNILIEVDGYILNPYYANNIAFTAPFGGIVGSANTIQLAIQDIETRKATLASPSFTGNAAFSNVSISGTATSVTPATSSNNTTIATTAFVRSVLNSANTFSINISGLAANATYATTAGNISGYTIDQNLGTTNNVQFGSVGVGTAPTGVSGEIVATGVVTAFYSDERLKTKLGLIENALDKVSSLSGFYFEPNEVAQSLGYKAKKEVGVSAQEVQAIMPEIVVPAPVDNKYLTVHYEKLIPLLIEAIKDLKKEVDVLKEKHNDN